MQRLPQVTRWSLALPVLAALCAPTVAQQREVVEPLGDPTPLPIATETVAGGPVSVIPIAQTRRGVPLPAPREVLAGAEGDEQLAERSGDPFFLGFAAGPYYPPADERIDPLLLAQVANLRADERPAVETYAFVMFAEHMLPEHAVALADAGARVLEFHPHYTLKVALTPEAIDAVAALPFVRWIGVPRPWQKQHPLLPREQARNPGLPCEIHVNVYDSDLGPDSTFEVVGAGSSHEPDGSRQAIDDPQLLPRIQHSRGWQERALTELGLDVQSYSDRVRAFRARATQAQIEQLVALDFVQFVEPVFENILQHDESMAMVNADRNRASWNGGVNDAAIVGVVDSGIDVGHTGLNHIAAWGWDLTGGGDPWQDNCGHGSHVAGTILGDPISTLDGLTGAAPGVGTWGATGRVFNVKLWNFCNPFSVNMSTMLGLLHTDVTDGNGFVTPKPHVINHSWGSSTPGPYFGTEADARDLDIDVYLYKQQHVYSAGNMGSGGQTLTLQASAKNTLAVGNVNTYLNASYGYPGNAASSSSRGPTADLRWGPQLCAPGVAIDSVQANTLSGYVPKSGTSMASPHVVGVAAQLIDEHPFLRYNPATLSAVLMAGSITKDSTLLSSPSFASNHHLNIYGTGRVDAIKARGGNLQQSTYFWGFSQGSSGYGQVEIPVNAGATQLTVVMHYKEWAASSGASTALINDLDLWIDAAPFAAGGNSGEYFAQQSTRDNTEVRIINNPTATTWRLKVFPESISGGLFNSSDVGLCAIVTYGDVTPNASLTVTTSAKHVKPNEELVVTGRVYNPSYYASAVYLEANDTGNPILEAEVTLADGIVTDLASNDHLGRKVLLGNIMGLSQREVRWRTRWASEGVKSFSVTASSDNTDPGVQTESDTITVDGTPPVGPSNLVSTTHTVGGSSCESLMGFSWTKATDALGGLKGYRVEVNMLPTTVPINTLLNVGLNETTYSTTVAPGTWYVHLRAMDFAGNWGTTQHAGPFTYAPGSTSTYCVAAPNSAGNGAKIGSTGSLSVAANAFTLTCQKLPSNVACIFFYANNQVQTPFGDGFLCINGGLVRLPGISSGSGTVSYALDFNNLPGGNVITGGQTKKFQNWYRDPAAGGAGFNLSDALSASFCP